MAQIQSGEDATLLTIDPTFNAARVSIRPPEVTGAYRLVMRSGTIAASTAATVLASFRYTGSGVAVVSTIRVGLNVIVAYTAGSLVCSAWPTRNWTVNDSGATYTPATLTGNNAKLRTSHATTSATAGIITTGTAYTAGSATEDSQAYGACTFNLPATVTGQTMQDLLSFSMQSHPMVCANNEGFRIRNDTAFAAAGTSNVIVQIEWFEATAY
jgi:hypothetical protein